MNLRNIFSYAQEKAFAKELVQKLVKELPPALMESRRKVLSVNKVTRLLERTFQQVSEYQKTQRLGFIGRAVLAHAFKWELKEAQYPEDFVDMATEGLVVTFSKR